VPFDLAEAGRVSSVYVYALLGSSARARRLRGHRIEFLKVGGVVAAVERRSEAPVLSEDTLRDQHEIVLTLARTAAAILPVRFGGFVDRAELERVIQLRQDVLRAALDAVRGHVQMTIRFFGPAEPSLPRRDARSGTDYLHARAAAARPELPPAASAVRDAVAALVKAERIDSGQGGVQATIHHLVAEHRAIEYRSLVSAALRGVQPAAQPVLSGPWPPFAFTPDLWTAEDAGTVPR
jgi:hypothetical protein